MPGYPIQIFLKQPEEKHRCSKCRMILKNPVQTSCGHKYCRSCVDEILSVPGQHVCITCGEENGSDPNRLITISEMFPDNAIKRELNRIDVRCVNKDCDWSGKFKDYEEHHDVCRKFLLMCTFCGKQNIPREKYVEHTDMETGDCTKKIGPCRYNAIGCTEMVEIEHSAEHAKEFQLQHLDLLFYKILNVSDSLEEFKRGIDIPGMSRKTTDQQNKIDRLEKDVKELENQVARVISQRPRPEGTAVVLENPLELAITRQTSLIEELKNKITVSDTKVSTYEGIIAILNRQIEQDSRRQIDLDKQRREDRKLIETLERKIRAQDGTISSKDVVLAEQDLRIQSLENASYDGILVWKITDFTQRRQDALAGRTTSFFSPCFYTSRRGYKMCARIYLNGDGMGKGNHVSLFFVIMKGYFDALLRWPFRQKVTFLLLDQNNREHVIDAFRPDPTSSSFKRPTSDMNVASGCPLFISISQLDSDHAYVKNDVMFIKVIVDTSDID